MGANVVKATLAEKRLHLSNFVCLLDQRQVDQGQYQLHGHAATSLLWRQDDAAALKPNHLAKLVICDQCQYGLVTSSADDPAVLLAALKPTNFMTNSEVLASQLERRCKKDHVHQQLAWQPG